MAVIEFDDFVDESRELKLNLPADFPVGKVRITVEPAPGSKPSEPGEDIPWEERPWTKEEIEELLRPNPSSLGEIAQSAEFGAWADLGIEDSQAWVDEVRRQEEERRRWPRD